MTNSRKFSTLILGPPGTGKSYFAGSVAALTPTLVLACKAREGRSIGYTRHGEAVTVENYVDFRWTPSMERFEADAYIRMLARLDELYNDEDYGAIVIDPLTDAARNVAHEILKHSGSPSPGAMDDARSFYVQLADKMFELVQLAQGLTLPDVAKRPKWLLIPMHVQPPKEDQQVKVGGQYVTKPSADRVARGIEYEGTALPKLDGSYRRDIAGDFDCVLYAHVDNVFDKKAKKMLPKYTVQVSPDRDRHSKIAVGVTQEEKVDNDFSALLEAIK